MGLTSKDREQLARKQDGRCYLCDKQTVPYDTKNPDNPDGATIDHVVPLKQGGTNRRSNLAMACRACNYAKDSLLPLDLTTAAGRDRALGLHHFLARMATCQPLRGLA